jgi:AraC-type DNA-binding domain-containing proteins
MKERNSEVSAAVGQMKKFISEHLHQPITASDVAKAAGYSQYHAARVFKAETGLAPFEYIRRQRLTASARALRSGKYKVLDVALDFVFDTHEGFTHAFTKGFGISPKRYATRPTPEGWLIPTSYLDRSNTNSEEWNMNKTSVIFTQIVDRPVRKLILRRGKAADNYFDYCNEIGCGEHNTSAAWDVLTEIKEALYEPVGVWLPENMRPAGTGVYAHGVEVAEDFSGEIPEEFEVMELPACQMMVFQGEPYDDEAFEEAVGMCMEQIKRFNPEVYGYEWAPELAPRMQLAPEGWRGYIEMLPVRRLG